jgi:sugar/nucleoside kinase (ribokinase family)
MTRRWDVLGLGIVAVDDLFYVTRFPEPDTKRPMLAERRQGGGLTGTALVAAARLGARAAYCGVMGEDDLAAFTLAELERAGVDCSAVARRPGARPIHAVIIVEQATGQRTILYTHEGFVTPTPDDISEELIAGCRVLMMDGYAGEGGVRAAQIARRLGIPFVADIERLEEPTTLALFELADHLIIGAETAAAATGAHDPAVATAILARSGRACCAVTAGALGCWYATAGGGFNPSVRHFPAFSVNVVDTTGCGDVFHGAYAAALARGERIERAVQIATAAAGMKATQPGGRAGIPSRAAVEAFLASRLPSV